MTKLVAHKGQWTHRFLIRLFAVIFGILAYWLLGFVTEDIGDWPGPSYTDIEKRLLDPALLDTAAALKKKVSETERRIGDVQLRQQQLRDSTTNSQMTMNQLLEIQRLSLQKGVTPSAEEQKALAESEQLFLSNQAGYQRLNEQVVQLNEELRDLQDKDRTNEELLQRQRKPIQQEYESLLRRHNLNVAAAKLAVLVPLLVLGVVLVLKKRSSAYAVAIYAFGIAVLIKVARVMHEHFPSRYFKYVLVLAAIGVVIAILSYLVRMLIAPRKEWLLKQYREAYEAFMCPICGYPTRRGPLKFMLWTRRSIRKSQFQLQPAAAAGADEPYTCPSCGTRLYEECPACRATRHSLLPSCEKCGSVKPLPGAPAAE